MKTEGSCRAIAITPSSVRHSATDPANPLQTHKLTPPSRATSLSSAPTWPIVIGSRTTIFEQPAWLVSEPHAHQPPHRPPTSEHKQRAATRCVRAAHGEWRGLRESAVGKPHTQLGPKGNHEPRHVQFRNRAPARFDDHARVTQRVGRDTCKQPGVRGDSLRGSGLGAKGWRVGRAGPARAGGGGTLWLGAGPVRRHGRRPREQGETGSRPGADGEGARSTTAEVPEFRSTPA